VQFTEDVGKEAAKIFAEDCWVLVVSRVDIYVDSERCHQSCITHFGDIARSDVEGASVGQFV